MAIGEMQWTGDSKQDFLLPVDVATAFIVKTELSEKEVTSCNLIKT